VFFSDPTACLSFEEGPGEAPIVTAVNWQAYLAATANLSHVLRPFAGKFQALPSFIEISEISARIPAADRGGTTDAYCKIFFRKLNLGDAAAALRDYTLVELCKSKLLNKTKCPSLVAFPDCVVRVPVETMVGPLPNCYLSVYDHDSMSRDDKLLEHTIDLTWSSAKDEASFRLHPTWVKAIEDLPANAGFSTNHVEISFTIKLIY
jgi:hypothetical protein